MAVNEADIVVTGLGMRTSVGQHADQSCAAVRAGINRFAEWPHFGIRLGEDEADLVAATADSELGDDPWVAKAAPLLTLPLGEVVWSAELYNLGALRQRPGG